MLQLCWKQGTINMHKGTHTLLYVRMLFHVSAGRWNIKWVNNCLMAALHWGQSVTERRKLSEQLLIPLSKLTNHHCKTCDPPPATASLCSLSSVYVWECFHVLKIWKLDQVQIYDRQEQKKKDVFFFFKRSGQTPPPPATSARPNEEKKLPVYFRRTQMLAF